LAFVWIFVVVVVVGKGLEGVMYSVSLLWREGRVLGQGFGEGREDVWV
jgi:hypothetical protein